MAQARGAGKGWRADFMMFSGVETADPLEVRDETGGGDSCMPVTSPVRTGTFACQIAMNTFTALRPVRSFEFTEMFARVYQRIDVVTPPAAEAFAPVIVFDARVPTGVTEVDVGVQPDGMIRYRLRNRLLEEDLGFSEVLPAGEWVQVELSTHMGAGTGSAEMPVNPRSADTVASIRWAISSRGRPGSGAANVFKIASGKPASLPGV